MATSRTWWRLERERGEIPLRVRLLLVFLGTGAMLSALAGVLLYLQADHDHLEDFQKHLRSTVALVAFGVDAERLAAIKDERDPAFLTLRRYLEGVRSQDIDIRDVYLMRPNTSLLWHLVVDVERSASPRFTPAGGEFDIHPDPAAADGLAAPIASRVPRWDSYGYWMSAFAPVRDRQDKVIAVLGMDFSAQRYLQQHRELMLMGTGFFLLGLALSGMIGWRFSRRIADPLELARARAHAELELSERARDQALEVSRLKSEFLATMSHEIRTPMHGILGMTELLMGSETTEAQRQSLRIVQNSAHALLTILNDVLDFSKIEAGKLQIEAVAFSPRRVMAQTLELFAGRDRKEEVNLTGHVDEAVPEGMLGDPVRVMQVLLNLVGNALKFTPRGRVEVNFAVLDGHLRVSVSDTGVGLQPEMIDRLFEPFQQADGSTTRRYGGTGLGLSISRRLVTLMEGQLGVESSPGQGSTFWFTMPLKPAPAPACDPLPASTRGSWVGPVLVVEDHVVNQRVIMGQVQAMGVEAVLVGSGQEAVDEALQRPYRLILMDCQMPGMDGFEATRRIRRAEAPRGARVPIVALTADAMVGVRERCTTAGMDDVLTKPCDQAQLAGVFDRWLVREASVAAARELPPPLDLSVLQEFLPADKLAEVLEVFVSTYQESLQDLERALATRCAPDLKFHAHTLRGAALNFRAVERQACCEQIENALVREDWAAIASGVEALEREASRVAAYLERRATAEV